MMTNTVNCFSDHVLEMVNRDQKLRELGCYKGNHGVWRLPKDRIIEVERYVDWVNNNTDCQPAFHVALESDESRGWCRCLTAMLNSRKCNMLLLINGTETE